MGFPGGLESHVAHQFGVLRQSCGHRFDGLIRIGVIARLNGQNQLIGPVVHLLEQSGSRDTWHAFGQQVQDFYIVTQPRDPNGPEHDGGNDEGDVEKAEHGDTDEKGKKQNSNPAHDGASLRNSRDSNL